ncbi:glutathione peroxidase [Dechloromonas sp. HYN0024]|uniref:glutathione peroxidase n=1 Tax=Dechloromonas sp. HYN0024 TaxID=2231055 RepID=UPI000E44FEC2|nr:glutathione peroxidase [Dechloromonas sp. HYN0024]AXS79674.1 glutathione peroxidase [Dechloromonas sp. HYN0024]
MPDSLYDIPLKSLDGRALTLGEFRGQVLLVVNVASKCGLTPQYAGLESLYKEYRRRGLQVLGFPCNDFAAQEPGSASDIQAFCTTNFGVDFPMFEKLNINSQPRHPLYAQLIAARPVAVFPAGSDFREKLAGYGISPKQPEDVLWNFEKFLIGRDGVVVRRFSPDMTPDDPALIAALEAALNSQP